MISKAISKIKLWIRYIQVILSVQQKRYFIGVLFITVITALLQMMGVSIILPLVQAMTDIDSAAESRTIYVIRNIFHVGSKNTLLIVICILTIVIYVVKNLFSIFAIWVQAKFSAKVERELIYEMLDDYVSKEYDFWVDNGAIKISRNIQTDTELMKSFLSAIMRFMTEVLTAAFIIIWIVFSEWRIAVVLGIISLFAVFLVTKVFHSGVKRCAAVYKEKIYRVHKSLIEIAEGIKEIKVLGVQNQFVNEYRNHLLEYQRAGITNYLLNGSPTYFIEMIFMASIMAFLMVQLQFFSASINVAALAAASVAAMRLLPSVGRISNNVNTAMFAEASVDTIYQRKILFSKREQIVKINKVDIAVPNFQHRLVMRNIQFKYSRGENVLDGLNLSIEKGKIVGIIGKSGAGKTTLIDILLGVHKPQNGEVLLDDVDITKYENSWCRLVGYIPQSVYVFDRSIKENVALGVPKEKINDTKVIEVLKKARLYSFVQNLENGIETRVGEHGNAMSGGQRQRLSIARALYNDPQIIIMDEATSALDNETESAVMESIEEMRGDITIIIVAHRLTTLKCCDIIYEVKDGIAVIRDKEEVIHF